jgi:hypothetical protein
MISDEAYQQYVRTALWAETDFDTEAPFDANYSIEDLSPETEAQFKHDLEEFFTAAEHEIQDLYVDAAHDFWLTRNRHGAGFWDGDWEEGEKLTEKAHQFSECTLYVGDDKLIYHYS